MAEIRCGRVRRAHGVRGEVRISPLGGGAGRFEPGLRVSPEGGGSALTVASAREVEGGDVLAAFEEVTSREAAESLRGRYLLLDEAESRELGEGEWFVRDLVGLAVVTPEDEPLGSVADIEEHPASDVLLVRGRDGERRFPMVTAFVRRVDLARRRIVVTPWEEEG